MIFRRLFDDGLAQASYLVGCERSGEAIVVDPNLDVDRYLAAARDAGVDVVAVTETHIHADFASGARALADATGAVLYLSGDGAPGWQYVVDDATRHQLLHDGDCVSVGAVRLDVRHTPGHTPEHLSFIVTDTARSEAPVGALTGDFIFVGDVGRPDLLERAAGEAGTMRAAAAALHSSIRATRDLPDHLQIWPGHGAGSACGRALGSAAQSTLGYERVANWAFAPMSESEFVERVLEGQPETPKYFGAMKLRNREPASRPRQTLTRKLPPALVASIADRVTIIDVREPREWSAGHIAGAQLIPLGELDARLGEIDSSKPIVVHCQRGARSATGAATLDAFGFDDVHELAHGFAAWEEAGLPIER